MSSLTAQRLTLRGRRRAEALMVDTITFRPVLSVDTDAEGNTTTTYGDPVYSGKCKIQQQRLKYPETPDAGQHKWTLAVTEIHLPVNADAANVALGHVGTIDSSFEPSNVGRLFRVETADAKTFQTAFRLICKEVIG